MLVVAWNRAWGQWRCICVDPTPDSRTRAAAVEDRVLALGGKRLLLVDNPHARLYMRLALNVPVSELAMALEPEEGGWCWGGLPWLSRVLSDA